MFDLTMEVVCELCHGLHSGGKHRMKGTTRLTLLSAVLLGMALATWCPSGLAETTDHTAHSVTPSSPTDHHNHPSPTPESSAYSVFMHHAAGVGLLLIGGLVLVDRMTGRRYPFFKVATGLTWIGMGIFLFIRSDPEAWPMGPPGFLESFFIPTTGEWVQHKILSMIPMFMGLYVMKGSSDAGRKAVAGMWHWGAVGLAAFGGIALLVHMHLDHPEEMDVVNAQHRLFAINALFIAASLIFDMTDRIRWKFKPYLLPIGLLLLGYQLFIYVE